MYNQVGTESVTIIKSINGLLLYKSVYNVFNIYHKQCLNHIQCIHNIILVKRRAKSCDPKTEIAVLNIILYLYYECKLFYYIIRFEKA